MSDAHDPEVERLVACYLDATVPEDRRDELGDLVQRRLAHRRAGSRAQVLALVHEVVEDRVDIAPVTAGVALIRECGLTPLAASLIVGLNREELQGAIAGEEEVEEPDEGATAILSEEYWAPEPGAPRPPDRSPSVEGSLTAPEARLVPIPAPPAGSDHYDTWRGRTDREPGRAIPAAAVIVALLVVGIVVVALVVTSGPQSEVASGPADDATDVVESPEPNETAPAVGTDGGGAADGDVRVAAAQGGDARAGAPLVAEFAVPAARDDLRWSLSSDGDELFEPTPLVVPPDGTGVVRLLIPPHFVRQPGVYTLRVLADGDVVVEHDFSVSAA